MVAVAFHGVKSLLQFVRGCLRQAQVAGQVVVRGLEYPDRNNILDSRLGGDMGTGVIAGDPKVDLVRFRPVERQLRRIFCIVRLRNTEWYPEVLEVTLFGIPEQYANAVVRQVFRL